MNFSVDTSHHDITADDLFLLSNDIPQSHSPDLEEDSDSEELDVGKLRGMYTLSGQATLSELVLLPFWKGFSLKGKNLLPNSFILQ